MRFSDTCQRETELLTSKNEKIMQPTKSQRPVSKGMAIQPSTLPFCFWQSSKIWLDHDSVVNMVTAVKISDMYTRNAMMSAAYSTAYLDAI